MSHVRYKALPWPDVAKSYQRMLEEYKQPFRPMLRLVKDIADSPFAFGLYGSTSMWDVQVVQTEEYDPDGEILKITYDPAHNEFTFELQETSSTLYKRWSRKCSTDKAFQTFERFLQMKKWFVAGQKQNP
jgi:hypothetical protein